MGPATGDEETCPSTILNFNIAHKGIAWRGLTSEGLGLSPNQPTDQSWRGLAYTPVRRLLGDERAGPNVKSVQSYTGARADFLRSL